MRVSITKVVERRETREKRSAQLERLKNSRMVGLSGAALSITCIHRYSRVLTGP